MQAPRPDPHGFRVIIQGWPVSEPCRGWTNAPFARPTRVVIAAAPSMESDASRLRAAVTRDLEALGTTASLCPGPSWLDCLAANDPGTRNLMVVLTGAGAPEDPLEQAVSDWLSIPGAEAIGAVRAGDDPDLVLPRALTRLHALTWYGDPLELAAQVIDAVLLDAEDRRIFVSYAHRDAATAEWIFDVLAKARFDVFLDRFRLPPGGDFVELIEDEIIGKSMVVVVETISAAQSHWVRHEVAIATKRGIGVAAVNLSNGPKTPDLDEDRRYRGPRDDAALGAFLIAQHGLRLAERRESQRESVWQALRDNGASAQNTAEHALGFTATVDRRRRVIGVSARPADVYRFRLVHEQAAGDEAFLVHPAPALYRRRLDASWLSAQSGVREVDEGRITEAAVEMMAP
jgi:TIR domain